MRVSVTVAEVPKEVVFEGDCPLFGGKDYIKGYDTSLQDIGFWLDNWRYAGRAGPPHNGRVFIPWSSALYIVEMK